MCAIAALAYMYFGGVIGNINSPNKNYQSLIDAYIDALSSGDAEKYVSLFPEEYVNAAKSKDEFYSRVSAYKEGYLARGNYSSGDVAYGSQYPSFTDVTGIEPAEVNDRTDEYNYISYSYNADRDDLTKYINRLTEEYDFLWDGTSEWNLNGTGEWNYTECMLVDNICGIDENLIIFPDNSDDGLIEIRAIRSISSYIERSDFRESAKTKFGQNLKSCEITDINDEENAELLRTVQDRSGQYGFEVSDAREFNIKEEYSDYTANATYWAVEVDNSWYIFDTYWFAAFVY